MKRNKKCNILKKKIEISSSNIHVEIKDLIWNRFINEVQKEYLKNNTIDVTQESAENFERFLQYKMRIHKMTGLFLIPGLRKDVFIVYNIFGFKYSSFVKSYFVTDHKFPYGISNVFILKK